MSSHSGLSYPDNQNPFDEREAKPRDGTVAPGGRGCEAEGEEKANPVEEKRH